MADPEICCCVTFANAMKVAESSANEAMRMKHRLRGI